MFIRIDGKMLMNEQKDDLMRDTLVRDVFYGGAHIELCLDLLHRFKPGLDYRMAEFDKQKAAGSTAQRKAVSPKSPKKKAGGAKPKGSARKPVANKKRTADAPAGPAKVKRRPRPSTPSLTRAPAQQVWCSRHLVCISSVPTVPDQVKISQHQHPCISHWHIAAPLGSHCYHFASIVAKMVLKLLKG